MSSDRHNCDNGPRSMRGPFGLVWGFPAVLFVLCGSAVWWLLLEREGRDGESVAGEVSGRSGFQPVEQKQRPEVREDGASTTVTVTSRWEAVLKAIAAESDGVRREELLQAALDEAVKGSIEEMLGWLEQAEPRELAREMRGRLVRRWAEIDPEVAATWGLLQDEEMVRERVIADVVVAWAARDIAEAAEWARRLPAEADRNFALRTVAGEAVRSQPVEALRIAGELPPDCHRDELMRRGAAEWALQDVRRAVQWTREIEDAMLREQVLAGVATAWAESDPRSAAVVAVDELSPGRLQSDTVVSIAQRWAQRSPEQAAAWVEQFPSSELKWVLVENVVAQWKVRDARRAEAWRDQMAPLPEE